MRFLIVIFLLRLSPGVFSFDSLPNGWEENSDQAQTAKIWLAAVEFETIQAETRREELRRQVDGLNAKLDQIISTARDSISTARDSWQAKVGRMIKCNAFLFARRWDECRAEVAGILQDIEGFKGEQNVNFTQFLSIQKKAAADLEAEARFQLVIISALEKDYEGAIKQAEEVRARYPKWSEKEKVDDVVAVLQRGICPFHIP